MFLFNRDGVYNKSLINNKRKLMIWWEDKVNLEFIVEDERSDEKSVRFDYSKPGSEWVTFNYVYNRDYTTEYIPQIKVLYKGEEQETYTFLYKRESFPYTEHGPDGRPAGFDYDRARIATGITDIGGYRVWLHIYRSKEAKENHERTIYSRSIYIVVRKGA